MSEVDEVLGDVLVELGVLRDRAVADRREALVSGADGHAATWEKGRVRGLEEAIDVVLERQGRRVLDLRGVPARRA